MGTVSNTTGGLFCQSCLRSRARTCTKHHASHVTPHTTHHTPHTTHVTHHASLVAQVALALASTLDLPIVASNDVRFLSREDFEAHEARVCIHAGRVLADPKRPRDFSAEQYLKTPDEMASLWADLPELIENSVELAQRCNLELSFGTYFLPAFPVPSEHTLDSYIRASAREGLEKRLADSTAEVNRLKAHLEQVRRDATTDSLTNLANRKAFDEEAAKAIAEALESGETLTMAVLDIDHFKSFNDTWGHQSGDQVIRFVASVIGRTGAPPRFAARYGGEEFAMIFPNEDAALVTGVLEDVRVEISSRMLKRRSTNEDLGQITISAGLAELGPGDDLHRLMDRADEALYASKHAGRNRVSLAPPKAKAAA